VALFLADPPDGDGAGVSCDGDAHVEGGFQAIGLGAFGDDDEDGKDDDGYVLPQPLLGAEVADPVALHDGSELFREHGLSQIDL
jgi:hypothetical protein